jgi:hypothetical protein
MSELTKKLEIGK